MTIIFRVDVPIASFPTSRSREYRASYPVPPPSTVYGMLLSLVGETDRYRHCGVKIAIGRECYDAACPCAAPPMFNWVELWGTKG